MNLQVVRWLIAHREVLIKVVEAVRKFDPKGTYLSKWMIINEVALLLIPMIDENMVVSMSEPDGDVNVYAAQLQDLGIDWQYFVDKVLPLIIAILQAVLKNVQ